MSKITLNNVANLQDTTTAATTINTNSATIQAAIDNTLSRDGTSPNTLNASLDMNGNRIMNLSAPGSNLEPIRVVDFTATPNTTLTFAAPTALVGTVAISGSASTTIHSDGAPAINQAMNPTWTGTHVFNNSITIAGSPAVTRTSTDTLTNKTLTSPTINTATIATPTITNGSITTATITSPTITNGSALFSGNLGWNTGQGAGGTVTQATSKSTTVTLNTQSGTIITNNAALSSAGFVSFTVNNSLVSANDIIVLNLASGAATGNKYFVWITAVANGSFQVSINNNSGGSLSEALTLNFAVIQGTIT